MEFLDTIKLSFGNNLLLGNTPAGKISLEQIGNRYKKVPEALEVEAFGLFDSNTNNFNTYYPDVTAEDLAPKDSDFITPTFRALSEVIVHKEWNPVDFSLNSVLRKSMPLLRGQTVNADHETAIGNSLGAISEVAWEESYKAKGGVIIPAGINSILKIDGKSNPKIARAILMDPPAIHSTSVTVKFLWEKSHPELSQDDFYSKIGSKAEDGKLIRRVATMVKAYHEISLVSHGADPYAQLVKDGGIVNPKYANVTYNSAKEIPGELKSLAKHYYFNFKSDVIENSIPEEIIYNGDDNPSQQTQTMKKELLLVLSALASIQGITFANPNEPTETELTDAESKLKEFLTANENTAKLLATQTEEVTRLKLVETAHTELLAKGTGKETQEFVNARTEELRTVSLANYNKLNPTPDAKITEMLSKADYNTLEALNLGYTTQLEEKYPMSCGKCGSTEVSRASAKIGEGGEDGLDGLTKLIQSKKNAQASGINAMNTPTT